MEHFKTVPTYFMAIYLLFKLLRFRLNYKKNIEKLRKRQIINLFDISDVLGKYVKRCKISEMLHIVQILEMLDAS